MPFEGRFDAIAEVIKSTVAAAIGDSDFGFTALPNIERLDWITSSNVIQQEIWEKILEADLVFCDVTGYNPNVMFEAGVSAAWKRIGQVVFIRDHFFKGQFPFDMAPIRFTEYQLTGDGIAALREKIGHFVHNAMIGFPDSHGDPARLTLPLHVEFQGGHDDGRIYTPPFAHRRVLNDALEFGSRTHFSHSWASVGKYPFSTFSLRFRARFSNPLEGAWMGVGLRSQHFFANFAHLLYLRCDGAVVITEPNEQPQDLYTDVLLRPPTHIDLAAEHVFSVNFASQVLTAEIDDFKTSIELAMMPKVFGSGLIRLQSWKSWMALSEIDVESLSVKMNPRACGRGCPPGADSRRPN